MIYIFDRNEVLLEIISEEDYSDFSSKDKLQASGIFSFNTSRKNNIKKGNKVGFFRKEKFQLFLIDDFTELTYVDESKVSVVTISDYNILSNSIIEDKRVINGTLREAAEKALEGSEYKVGIVEDFESKNINFYFVSRLKALNDIINTFNCEIDVRIEIDDSTGKIINKYIDFKHRLGKDTGLRFTFDTNLEVIEKSPIGDHFNVLYGRGKSLETDSGGYSRKLDFAEVNNGKKYVEDLESIKKYGRLEGIYEDGNIEDKQLLLSKTLEKLEEIKNPKFTYKVSLKNLMAFDKFEHYQCEKGDTILIVDEEEDLVLEARVVEISEEDDEVILTLSNIQTGLMDEDLESEIGDIKDKIDIIENNKPTIDTIYPDTLPDIPILTAKALYASVILDWTYSNKDYYTYELFASQIKDFNPTPDNRIFEGKASSFLHEVNPSQTWYYRARAKNTYENTTLFSTQVEVTTCKISDSAEIFEEAAIGHAIIKDLDMDKATVGKLKGQRIDARNLTVTDGNEKETLSIDSYGNVNLDVTKLSINSKKVISEDELNKNFDINLLKNTLPNGNGEWQALNGSVSFVTSDTELKIHIINTTKQADTILIQENDKNILVDCGYRSTANVVIEYLKANGVTDSIDLFIATHAHTDHIGAFEEIANEFSIKEVIYREADWNIVDQIEPEGWGTSAAHRKMLEVIKNKNIFSRESKIIDVIKISNNGELRLINTTNEVYDEYNTRSLGIIYTHYNHKILLASDMTIESEKHCLGEIGKVDVLKVGHHGANGSNHEAYLEEIKPRYGLITTIDIDHIDRKKALGCLQWEGIPMYDTGTNGTFVITSTKDNLSVSNLNKEYKLKNQWWYRRTVNNFEEWVYFKADGSIARNETVTIGGGFYEFDENGICKEPY
ncbi:phage tail protein [Clostridium perfringens]|uniref:phage tail protein n=1 Tax=Clostridium perfringens TaxID=1502 RepID=UPI002247E5D0|nr:phage tail protein [Clostridium perfringens]MCX0403284.1 phage tail protein [Clostridium perfringens]